LTGHNLSAAQGVYLKGQGIVYTASVPTHFQKVVGGPDNPGTKVLTEWERVRRELRGEKVDAQNGKPQHDTSIADPGLRLPADNGKTLTHRPDGEKVTVALTLVHTQACTTCHGPAAGGGGGRTGPGFGGPGAMGPGAGVPGPGPMSAGPAPAGG